MTAWMMRILRCGCPLHDSAHRESQNVALGVRSILPGATPPRVAGFWGCACRSTGVAGAAKEVRATRHMREMEMCFASGFAAAASDPLAA